MFLFSTTTIDYNKFDILIQIPQANTAAIANTATVTTSIDKFCGRFLALTSGATASATICCKLNFGPFFINYSQVLDKGRVEMWYAGMLDIYLSSDNWVGKKSAECKGRGRKWESVVGQSKNI